MTSPDDHPAGSRRPHDAEPGCDDAQADRIFALGSHIRYVAIARGSSIMTRERAGLTGGSSPQSDFYEELLVNPTILGIAARRGELDCGGLEFVIVGYGLFNQVVVPTSEGHVSVAVQRDADATAVAASVAELVRSGAAESDR